MGQTDIGTSSLHGLGDSEDSRADGMMRGMFAEYRRDFQFDSDLNMD